MQTEETTSLVASPATLRSIAKTLQERNVPYIIERVTFKNFNPYWKGTRGLALRITIDGYNKLYK